MDKQRKKLIKRYLGWAMLALLVVLLSIMPLLAQKQADDGPHASILTAKAEVRSIDTQIIGGGQLAGETSETVTIPATVKLTNYLVGNGETVTAGDPVARVDKVSVLMALQEVQQTLDHLSEKLADAESSTVSNTLTAEAGGFVKILWAEKGDSVQDVMLEHGALAVVSLDGRMAVQLEAKTDFTYGSAVRVTLEDGTQTDGRVESAYGGKLVVSVKDSGYAIGETVTVVTTDGTPLGAGELYIHNAWNVVSHYGTITAVNVAEGQTISAGTTLFRLESSEHTPEFQILNAQRQEYEDLMQKLFLMYESGVVTAPCDGFVTGVDTSGSFLLSADTDGWFIQLLSNDTPPADGDNDTPPESPDQPEDPEDPKDPDAPETPEDPEDPEQPEDPGTGLYKVRLGQVIAADQGALSLKAYPADVSCDSLDELSIETSLMTATIARNISGATIVQSDLTTPYGSPIVKGDILCFVTNTETGESFVVWLENRPVSDGAGGLGGLGGFGGLGGLGGFGGLGGNQEEAFQMYSLEEIAIATVTSQERMTLEATVDEQDVAKLRTGMEATVTVDALTGQSFPATITKISNTGTNAGGSSKFTVRFTLTKSGSMLPGMHCTAYVTLETTQSGLTIPVAALNEYGTEVFVYTSYDQQTEQLGDPISVATGVSDGEYVQILTDLPEGTVIYYPYYNTLEISNIPEPAFGF